MKRCLLTLIAGLLCSVASAQAVFRMQYWFDGQHENQITSTSSTSNWQPLIETSQLSFGLHTLFLQVQDSTGKWFSPCSYLFYRVPDGGDGTSVQYSYWFDNDHTQVQTDSTTTGNLLLDAGMLTTGLHAITFQFNLPNYVSFKRYLFYKASDTHSDSVEYVVWFDHDYDNLLSGHTLNGHLLLDVDSLSNGIHTLNAQFRSGEYHTFKSSLFYKAPAAIGDSVEYVFWFDQDQDNRQTGYALNSTLLLDVDSLSSGVHTLNARLGSGDNITYRSFVFYKRPYDENKIVKFEYWINDLDSLKQTVSVSPQDTVDLVSMLSVPSLPIRSQSFHFNPNNGVPVIHAKNDIYLRFYNAAGRYANKTKSYVDFAMADTIYADTIERNTTKIVAAPTNNAIHWFKLGASAGDSLSFKTDKPCTMQLYAPNGEMLFHVSNDSVFTWNNCRAGAQGDYYLAVHDAADTGTISVSYQWIYRYAVLAWDVHRVGNGGISTITFEGNGFSSLDTMFLVRGTDTIPTLYIERVGNTTMSVVFNFEGVDTGMYDGVFVYTDENLFDSSVVYVEEARPIVLQTTCSYPSAFLRGSTVTFTYTITNTGNMTAYNVPIQVYISSSSLDAIKHVNLGGINLPKLYTYINVFDSLSTEDKNAWIDYSNQIGDIHYFVPHINEDENGDSVAILLGYFFINIAPFETKVLSLEIIANSSVEAWFSSPSSWVAVNDSVESENPQLLSSNNSRSEYIQSFCCHHDTFEMWMTGLSQTATYFSFVMWCLPEVTATKLIAAGLTGFSLSLSIASALSQVSASLICQGRYGNVKLLDSRGSLWTSAGIILNSFSCLPGINNVKIFSGLVGGAAIFTGFPSLGDNIANSLSVRKSPECSPDPPKGGVSTAVNSLDPNEITGYLAESGSHAVSAEQMQMPFMIEFENDTMFATAPAHTVVVKDTLDGEVFDLESFSATSFGFGENLEMINGEQSFTRFVDMRPVMDVIAQVQLNYYIDSTFAVATWTFSSLDTLTLLPITDPGLGFLPVNFNGDGVGEVHFTINRKAYLLDSTFIRNRAWITFDNEVPIPTSVWTNIVDNTPPEGQLVTFTDSTGERKMRIVATDNLSGVWRYDLYGQRSDVNLLLDAYIPADSSIVVDPTFDYESYYSLASDSAGNRGRLLLFISQYTVTAISADSTMGTIDGAGNYTDGDTAVLTAHANCGFHFLHWADNVTDNPRQVVVRSDITLMAVFEADSAAVLFETQCDSYTWQNGMTYISSGIYYDTLTNVSGCDSVVTLHLTISESPSPHHISGQTELCINQFATFYYDISNPNYHYRWLKNNELWAEDVPNVILHEMNQGSVLLKMQVTDEQSGCDADTSLLVQVVNRIAPDTTEIRRKVNTDILVCQTVYSEYGEVHYRWGYTDLQTSAEVVMPDDHNYCLYEFGIDTLSFRYWVETYLDNAIGEGCENRSYYGHGYTTSVSDYDKNVVEAYLSNDRVVLYLNILNPENISTALYDVNGKLLLTREYGTTNLLSDVIPVSIAPGVYLFRVSVGNRLYSFKLLKI